MKTENIPKAIRIFQAILDGKTSLEVAKAEGITGSQGVNHYIKAMSKLIIDNERSLGLPLPQPHYYGLKRFRLGIHWWAEAFERFNPKAYLAACKLADMELQREKELNLIQRKLETRAEVNIPQLENLIYEVYMFGSIDDSTSSWGFAFKTRSFKRAVDAINAIHASGYSRVRLESKVEKNETE